ncbi:MAG: ribonuclease [Lachnospiraceae bacterium]|nr:ribonuclease [Lachnospiraceae bacterium]MDD7023941.1 ribonuclease domain-containing protein [Oscillospiraceae bacterium]MDY5541325.1 ribonuclease domain-containing protein [Lachnospiraceae bacterium]
MKKWLNLLLSALLVLTLTACGTGTADTGASADSSGTSQASSDTSQESTDETKAPSDDNALLPEDGTYTSREDVALYIHQYGCLPSNFITKKEAEKLGWTGGSLEPYAPGMCIGGSRFGNYEGLLPEKDGRTYTECDIDTLGAEKRGAKRIVFSNDGLIYYTEDHYESFELLYGEVDDD